MSKPNVRYPTLEILFNSRPRVKVLKFLFRNYPVNVSVKELSKRTQEPTESIRKEMNDFSKIGLVKVLAGNYHALDNGFEFFDELKDLILKSSPAEKDKMIQRITGLGQVKLAIISGVFLNSRGGGDSEVDLFIVGDKVKKYKLRKFLRSLEAEVGKEIRFGLMEKKEFEYRHSMFDRFVRVLLDSPHEKLINKLGL